MYRHGDGLLETVRTGANLAGYSLAGTYRDTFAALSGCDSIRLLLLSVLPTFATTLKAGTCDPAQAGIFQSIFSAASGIYRIQVWDTTGKQVIARVAVFRQVLPSGTIPEPGA